MRDIKFRGFYPKINCWLYGLANFEYSEDQQRLTLGAFWLRVKEGLVDLETVGEYIGLQDKNGLDVYEGDITCVNESHKALKADFGGHIRLVQWRHGGACFDMLHSNYLDSERKIGLMFDNGMVDSIEVVGNIYESPELIE